MSIDNTIREIVREELQLAFREHSVNHTSGDHSTQSQVTVDKRWDDPIAVPVKEAARLLGIKHSLAYELIHRGVIPVVKLGPRCMRVPVAELRRRISEMAVAGGHGSPVR